MKSSLPWIIAGIGLGAAITYIVLSEPTADYATGRDDIDDAADKTSLWGVKQRFAGTGGNLAGKLKEGIGRATGQTDLAGEGVADQVTGTVKDAAGKAANAVGETIRDLNR